MTQTGDPDKTLKTREVKDSQGNGYLIDDPDVLRLMGEMEGQLQPFFRGEATLLVTDKPLEMEDSHDGGEDEVPFNEDYSLGEQIHFYRKHLDIFIEDYYGIKLYDPQKIVARAIGNCTDVSAAKSRGFEPEAEEPQPSSRMLANKVYADRMAAGQPKGEQD